MLEKKEKQKRRQKAIRAKISGTKERPRLNVFRSSKHTYAQIIDDNKQVTIISMSDKSATDTKKTKTEKAFQLGEKIAEKAKEKKIDKIVFDRSGYLYHGRVKALADGARKGGLKF
jgi:large subunit ribosomal protein L18